ncbi:MAG: glycosyltransferase family 9 protein [Chitinophagaceae bacterium]
MPTPFIYQDPGFALGNFINLTPGIKRLSEIAQTKIDVHFATPFVKACFTDCPFIHFVEELNRPFTYSSRMVNQVIPDYQYCFKNLTGEDWSKQYHTYIDTAHEIPMHQEPYLLLLNGLAGISLNDSDPKPFWFGKKEISEAYFIQIKNQSNLPIYFTGSASDLKQNPWIAQIANKISIGNIRESLALVRDATKIIANDTGLAHAAGAMNKEMLILWKDTPFEKNKNPGIRTTYAQKNVWEQCISSFLLK